MTGIKDKNRESSQPKRSSARLREVQSNTPSKDTPKETVSPGDVPNTRGMATRASIAKDSTSKLSPTTSRKQRAETSPPESVRKSDEKRSPELIDLSDDVPEEPPKDIKRSPKKPRRSKRDIRRPKFDDEIVPAPSTTAKEPRKKKSSSVVDSGAKAKISKSSTDSDEAVAEKTSGAKVRAKSVAPVSKPEEVVMQSSTDESKFSSSVDSTAEKPNPVSNPPPPPAPKEEVPTSSAASAPPQTQPPPPQPVKKSRTSKPKNPKSSAANQNQLAYENPIYGGIVNDTQSHWNVEDDIILMASVQHLCDVPAVLANAKFSKNYSLTELEERWFLMMYDEAVSKFVRERVAAQTRDFTLAAYKKVPFSADEDKLIKGIDPTSKPTIEVFQKLRKNKIFPLWRDADDLMARFHKLKNFVVKKKDNKANSVHIIHDDIEQNLDFVNLAQKDVPTDTDSNTIPRDLARAEVVFNDNQKAPHDAIAGSTLSPQMPSNAFAQLRGREVAFNIIHPQVVIGRSTADNAVDINLDHEGPSSRICRTQAAIKLVEDTDTFFIYNIGRNPIFVDKRVLHHSEKWMIDSNSKITFGMLEMLFLRNEAKRTKPKPMETDITAEPTTNGTTVCEVDASKPTPPLTTIPPTVPSSQAVPATTSAPTPAVVQRQKYQITDEGSNVKTIVVASRQSSPRRSSQEPGKCKQSVPDNTPLKQTRPAVVVKPVKQGGNVHHLVQKEQSKRVELAKAISDAAALNRPIMDVNPVTKAPKPFSGPAPTRAVVFKKPVLPNKNQKNPANEKK